MQRNSVQTRKDTKTKSDITNDMCYDVSKNICLHNWEVLHHGMVDLRISRNGSRNESGIHGRYPKGRTDSR